MRDLTTGEAAAWRAGWEAAREAAAQRAERIADEIEKAGEPERAMGADAVTGAIRAMEPPA